MTGTSAVSICLPRAYCLVARLQLVSYLEREEGQEYYTNSIYCVLHKVAIRSLESPLRGLLLRPRHRAAGDGGGPV